MITNIGQFNAEVEAFAVNTMPERLVALQKKISLELLRRIVEKSPVKTGLSRGNWQLSVNGYSNSEIERLDESVTIEDSNVIPEESANLAGLRRWSVVYITNNVPYIEFLEEGTSSQAPSGMVRVSLEELRAMFA